MRESTFFQKYILAKESEIYEDASDAPWYYFFSSYIYLRYSLSASLVMEYGSPA
jgi:hypothetical protein